MRHLVKGIQGLLLSTLLFGASVFGQTQEMVVKLQTLEVLRAQEKGGDELYLNVTEFPTQSHAHHYQIPSYPSHWLSKYANSIKDVVIWKKSVKACEPVDLLITLVEEDFAPWNIDDTLGSVELKIKCVNGKAIEEWTIPDAKNTVKIEGKKNTFQFNGDNAQYQLIFKLDHHEVKDKLKIENKSN